MKTKANLNLTIKQAARLAYHNPKVTREIFANFLDDFYRQPTAYDKYALIADEPDSLIRQELLAELAAMIELLCIRHGLTIPYWAYKDIYYLSTPTYAFDTNNSKIKAFLEATSVDCYKKRNLFLGDENSVIGRA